VRVAAWVSAVVVAALAITAGVGYAANRAAAGGDDVAPSTAPRAVAGVVADPADPQLDPPHVVPPPSPSPTSRSPAPPSSGTALPVRSRPPSIVIGSRQQALINQDRASRGLPPLTWSSCLYNVAVANARRIAAQGYLSHTNGPQTDLGCRLGNQAGENIGCWSLGINDVQLNAMFMNSPEHYANIMGPYHYVATAWVVASNGYGYIAVEFS
jgi:uncharacterized protein YkwD